jgi:simple sugar transport system substrate-binding protein
MNFVGNEEYTAGLGGGDYFGSHGVKNVLCINTLPGANNTEDRCKGVGEAIGKHGGKSSQLPLPSSSFGNPTEVAQAIKAALLKDGSVDGLITISAGDANSAANAISQANAGDKVKLASFDMDETGLDRIKDGKQMFAVDQQPYLQGFLAVSLSTASAKSCRVLARPRRQGSASTSCSMNRSSSPCRSPACSARGRSRPGSPGS